VEGDVFLHNPRGSNNRLNEANTNRNNANRLFDSQNNAKGGYCVGPAMTYYEGSYLDLEWTVQHGCSNPKIFCTVILQYMCSNTNAPDDVLVRDGTDYDEVPDDPTGPTQLDANGDPNYGVHETYDYYQGCKIRERNKGLWVADRTLGGNSAINTRQNVNGTRFAYECPEERDYYPYWHPSPWKDIAVFVDDPAVCPYYTTESQNVKPKGFCRDVNGNPQSPNNPTACTTGGYIWSNAPAFGIAAPDCLMSLESRDNYLGNTVTGETPTYRWKLPSAAAESCILSDNCNCVLRIRYNATSSDLGTYSNQLTNSIDYNQNGAASPVKEDPSVTAVGGLIFSLAIDTSQIGRTWQDRSYVFHIKSRTLPAATNIYNLGVKGKRGNDIQVYPAEQYAYSPSKLYVNVGEYVHFQWTGCDTNPAGNAGEGTDQTDRSNIIQISDPANNVPANDPWLASNPALFQSAALRSQFAFLNQANCLTYSELAAKNNNNVNSMEQDIQNCMKLNYANGYFDGGLVKMNTTGSFWFMSSRNNNFSNRGQKGNIIVQ